MATKIAKTPRPTRINLALIGKTGQGKSHTGNSILMKEVFDVSDSTESETVDANWEVREYNGQIIKVVDLPGAKDTRIGKEEAFNTLVTRMKEAMLICPGGYDAFLYVTKYPSRFTEEDVEALDILKKILKPDFMKKHCILLMTGGDEFEFNYRRKGKTLEGWIQEQKGKFAELIRECGNRVVQFDNRTEDTVKQQAQLDRLLAEVHKIQQTNGVYTDENFERAKALLNERQKSEAKGAVIEEIALEEFRLLLDKVLYSDHNDLPNASSRCAQLIISLEKSNKDGKLNKFVGKLRLLKQVIDDTFREVQTQTKDGDKTKEMIPMKLLGHVQNLELLYLYTQLKRSQTIPQTTLAMFGEIATKVLAPLALVNSLVLVGVATVRYLR
ncbi:immune-associated nucleotide-binding protein 5 [Elysia marginata]|uniref:Immune-associated nucleotide-binding protein 5 n=1 Tax=Elysia marginata TaxID=1093978 RepID=A0AAV4HDQ5_9GAST|nr:immune-associated nucleotide-binding protein 5 [Elysia marginata]